mgnify:CR=1 FL=1
MPLALITGGRIAGCGKFSAFRKSVTAFSSEFQCSLQKTVPRLSLSNRKWWYLFRFGSFLKYCARKFIQSYVGTKTVPLWRPTSSEVLTDADCSTALAMSNKDETNVRRVFCLRRPKHQSGENLVCPANKKLYSTVWWRPVITRQR